MPSQFLTRDHYEDMLKLAVRLGCHIRVGRAMPAISTPTSPTRRSSLELSRSFSRSATSRPPRKTCLLLPLATGAVDVSRHRERSLSNGGVHGVVVHMDRGRPDAG